MLVAAAVVSILSLLAGRFELAPPPNDILLLKPVSLTFTGVAGAELGLLD